MKKVSIIIPCYNEANFIAQVLDNALAQDYPFEWIEVLVVDGRSTDQTRSIVAQFQEQYPNIKLIDNPDRFTPHAFNRGIRAASGNILFIWGAHSAYPNHYLSRLIDWLEKSGADNVGGILNTTPRQQTAKAIGIARVLSHPLGVGNSAFRTGIQEPMEVDTVPFGCYRKEVFERFGHFDERLLRNQDIEHNRRIKSQGGRLLLVPDVSLTYYARSTFRELWTNNAGNGEWVVRAAKYTGTLNSLSLRHFVPLAFVGYLGLLLLLQLLVFLQIISPSFLLVLALPLAVYSLGVITAAAKIGWQEKRLAIFGYSLLAFWVLHLGYGWGSWSGCLKIFTEKTDRK